MYSSRVRCEEASAEANERRGSSGDDVWGSAHTSYWQDFRQLWTHLDSDANIC